MKLRTTGASVMGFMMLTVLTAGCGNGAKESADRATQAAGRAEAAASRAEAAAGRVEAAAAKAEAAANKVSGRFQRGLRK